MGHERSGWEILGKVLKLMLKIIWKLFLLISWGFLRLIEVISGQLAKLLKEINH